ncbi:MAG TPA: hypothetical protein VL120_18465 [Solirubrobacteraceae bacterium]|jgi:hypothetical protein|nr:hypothetical protein [Solirubrobacteraceae bacterium]
MTARAAALVVAVLCLAGCGGSSGGSATPAAGAAKTRALLQQTFGPNPAATSGRISGTIDITVTGVPRYTGPVSLSMSGPFDTAPAGGTPQADLSLGIRLRDQIYGASMFLVGDDQVLIGLGPSAYQVPAALAATIRKPLAGSRNVLGSVLDVFAIAPGRWAANAKMAGNASVGGVDTVHMTAGIDLPTFFDDAARFTRVLTSLRFTEIAGLPQVITPRMRAALVRSVTSATGDVYTGASDHVVRRAHFDIRLRPSAADRRLLAGIRTMRLVGELGVSDVGAPQKVAAPPERGSYRELQLTFDALGESARRKERGGK